MGDDYTSARPQRLTRACRYCKQYHQAGTETDNVFLTLLRIYLRPTIKTNVDLLQPALELISRHSRRLDTTEALQLLPPLVTLNHVRTFLIEGLRIPIFDTNVARQINKARNDQIARKLLTLHTKRVKVTDSRMSVFVVALLIGVLTFFHRCPQCHKRIGPTIIAVHSPR